MRWVRNTGAALLDRWLVATASSAGRGACASTQRLHLPAYQLTLHRCRWINHLKPDISKEAWTRAEEQILLKAYE